MRGLKLHRGDLAALGIVVCAHAGAAWALLRTQGMAVATPPSRPMLVQLMPVEAGPKVEVPPPATPSVAAEPSAAVPPATPRPRPRLRPRSQSSQASTAPLDSPRVSEAEGLPPNLPAASAASDTPAPEAVDPEPPQSTAPPLVTLQDIQCPRLPRIEYPDSSRRLGEAGTALVRVWVDSSGRPQEAQIHLSSGSPRLDRAALASVRVMRCLPRQQAGMAQGVWVLVPIVFRVE